MEIDDFPLVKKSIIQFGIIDFVGLSTANPTDRDTICQSIEQSIAAHEPRLKQIKVEMQLDDQKCWLVMFKHSSLFKYSPTL